MTQMSGGVNGARQSDLAKHLANQLASELRELRRRSGMSLRELERPTLSSDSSLSRYLAGRALPPWQVVQVLSERGDGDTEKLRSLWTRAIKARAQARVVEGEQRPQPEITETERGSGTGAAVTEQRRRIPVRWLVAIAAAAGLAGIVAGRRAVRATASA